MTRSGWLAIACALLACGTAGAQPVVDHYQRGRQLFADKQYAAAIEEFRRALSIAPRPDILYSLAQAQRMIGDCASAIDSYRAFLAGQPTDRLAEYARANIERCERTLRESQPPRPPSAVPPSPAPAPPPPPPATGERPPWYHDTVGDVLIVGGALAGVAGTALWHAGRDTATRVGQSPDYQTFLARSAAASSALTEQRLGVAAMVTGGAAIVAGVIHCVRHTHSARGEPAIGVAWSTGGPLLVGRGSF